MQGARRKYRRRRSGVWRLVIREIVARLYRHSRTCAFAPAGAAHAEPELPDTEDRERNCERRDVVEKPEQQQAGEELLLVVLPKRDQHCGIENTEPARRVAGK